MNLKCKNKILQLAVEYYIQKFSLLFGHRKGFRARKENPCPRNLIAFFERANSPRTVFISSNQIWASMANSLEIRYEKTIMVTAWDNEEGIEQRLQALWKKQT